MKNILIICLFCYIFIFSFVRTKKIPEKIIKKKLFPLVKNVSLDESKNNNGSIIEISKVSLHFVPKDNLTQIQNAPTNSKENSDHNSSDFNNNTVIFKPLRYKSKEAPDLPFVLSPEEEDYSMRPQENYELENNDSYFQAYYSNYFRKYYQNLQNVYNNKDESPGSIYVNPNRNIFMMNNPPKKKLFKSLPYQEIIKMRQNANNPCFCQDKRVKFCDCDEIDNSHILQLKPIVMPIIQPVIQKVPLQIAPGEECMEDNDDCSCSDFNEDYFERSQLDFNKHIRSQRPPCKCGCNRNILDVPQKNENKSEPVNINNANTNNANVLAQKNTINKIENVYSTNYSTTNFNHHIHNYINGADFKFKENENKIQQPDENCQNKSITPQYFPKIEVINKIKSDDLMKTSMNSYKITTKIDKSIFKKLNKDRMPDESKENYTGVMNQAIENTIKFIHQKNGLKHRKY